MKGCSLDLCLSPMTSTLQSCRQDSTDHSSAMKHTDSNAFYSEGLSESDLVEFQLKIRAIIEMASKEREVTTLELALVRLESPFGCSVKRSVKRFLEKRKKRSKTITLTPRGSISSSSSPHNF